MNKNDYIIRLEKKEEYRAVEDLVRESFWNVYKPGAAEHYVLHVLRDDPAFVKELDLVMCIDACNEDETIPEQTAGSKTEIEADEEREHETIIGQIIGMKTVIEADDGRTVDVLTMGPLAILPELKRHGYGKALLDYAVEKAAELGFGAVLFEGNYDFYRHCGFEHAGKFGIRYHDMPEGEEADFLMCRELIPGFLDGVMGVYQTPKGYYVDDADVDEFDKSFPPKKKLRLPGQLF